MADSASASLHYCGSCIGSGLLGASVGSWGELATACSSADSASLYSMPVPLKMSTVVERIWPTSAAIARSFRSSRSALASRAASSASRRVVSGERPAPRGTRPELRPPGRGLSRPQIALQARARRLGHRSRHPAQHLQALRRAASSLINILDARVGGPPTLPSSMA
jgi:hypothetical protein